MQLSLWALTERSDWWLEAACQGSTGFFPTPPGGAARLAAWDAYRREVAEAKAVCAACPVKTECLDYALDHDEEHLGKGIWGGTTYEERAGDPPALMGMRWRRNRSR